MDNVKSAGTSTMLNTALVAFVLIVFILFFVNRLIGPYMSVFDAIKSVMKRAQDGDYSGRINVKTNAQSSEVADAINTLLDKLQRALSHIEEKIDEFLTTTKHDKVDDPPVGVQTTVARLADIYRFRKTIEHDERIEDLYERLAHVLSEKFALKDFNFIEANTTKKEIKVAYIHKELHCDAELGCCADRTSTIVDSLQFSCLCEKVKRTDIEYLCVSYSISNDFDFVLNITTATESEALQARELLPQISDYIDAAKPEIVSKKLMQVLEESTKRDDLTGLYNRKYLEESIDKIVEQSKRADVSYGVLMADIDYFKMVNDTYGHDVGDEALKVIGNTLLKNVRESDVVIRYGGEEFIVLLYNCDEKHVFELAEKIRKGLLKNLCQPDIIRIQKVEKDE